MTDVKLPGINLEEVAKMTPAQLEELEAMLSANGWQDIGVGSVEKWDEGEIVYGPLIRVKQGKFGKLGVFRTMAGVKTYGLPTILEDKLANVRPGDMVYIRCTGKTVVAGGEAWDFRIFTAQIPQGAKLPF